MPGFVRLVVLAVLAIGVMSGVGAGTLRSAAAGSIDSATVVEDFFALVDDGDIEGAASLLADDLLFTEIHEQTGSFATVGEPAFSGSVLEETVATHLSTVLTDLDADGDVVTGVAEFTDDVTAAAGVDRRLQPFTITLNDDGKIARADFTFDASDPQTATYLEYQSSQGEGEDEGPPPGSTTVSLAAQPGGSQPGVAFIFEDQGLSFVGVFIEPGPSGVLQPAHFHTGTCANPGPIVQPLASVLDGSAFTLLSATQDELVDSGLIINVHKSVDEPSAYVSCGEVLSAPEPAPSPTPAAIPTATAGTGVTAPNTGSGPDAASGDMHWTIAITALLTLGAITVLSAVATTRSREG